MSKHKNDEPTLAEDYLAQVKWENDHPFDKRGRPSVKYEPKWKYKRIYRTKADGSKFITTSLLVAIVATLGYLFSQFFIYHSTDKFFPGILILTVIIIIYVVIRDPQKRKK